MQTCSGIALAMCRVRLYESLDVTAAAISHGRECADRGGKESLRREARVYIEEEERGRWGGGKDRSIKGV